MTSHPVVAGGLLLAVITTAGCGTKREAEKGPPPPSIGLPAKVPVAPPPPRKLPTFITLDEIRAHTPAMPGVRMTTEVALDGSGKQGLGSACVTATGAKVAMHQLADAYGVARWVIKVRTTSQGDARGEFIGDFELYDGTLHVRGVVQSAPTCQPGEVGLALYYSKVVDAPKPPPPPPAGGAGSAEPNRAAPRGP